MTQRMTIKIVAKRFNKTFLKVYTVRELRILLNSHVINNDRNVAISRYEMDKHHAD